MDELKQFFKKVFAGGGVWFLIGALEIFQKLSAWEERGEGKIDGGCDHQRKYAL